MIMDIPIRLLSDGEKICFGRAHATKYLPKKRLVLIVEKMFEWLHVFHTEILDKPLSQVIIEDAEYNIDRPCAAEYSEAYQRQFEIRKQVCGCIVDEKTGQSWSQDILMTVNIHAIARPMLPPEKDVKDDSHG